MKDKSLDYLEEWLHHHDSIDAGNETLRRLREVVPLLEEMRANCADWDEGQEFTEEIDRALALVKGTAEAATGGDGTEE